MFSDKRLPKFRRKEVSASSGYRLGGVGKVAIHVEEAGVGKDTCGQSETRMRKRNWGSGLGPHCTVGPQRATNAMTIFILMKSCS